MDNPNNAPQDALPNFNAVTFQEPTVAVSGAPNSESNHPIKWMKLSVHVAGFLSKDTRPPGTKLAPSHHNHVALTQNRGVHIIHEEKQYVAHTVNIYQESLHDVICLLKDKDFKHYDKTAVAVLRDICQGIQDLHKQNIDFGEFTEHTIMFSCDKSKIVITNDGKPMPEQATAETEFLCLARVFFFVLSRGCELNTQQCFIDDNLLTFGEKQLAKDVIETLVSCSVECRMSKGTDKLLINDILDHPFFWSDLQKITFACDAFDLVSEKNRNFQENLNKEAMKGSVIPEDWIGKMKLLNHEITAIKNKLDESSTIKPGSIHKNHILQFAIKKCANSFRCFYYKNSESKLVLLKALTWPDFQNQKNNSDDIFNAAEDKFGSRTFHVDGGFVIEKKETTNQREACTGNDSGLPQSEGVKNSLAQSKEPQIPLNQSIFELLQFFRNQQCHFWEAKELTRVCFQDQTTGYWNFFSSRFPKLLWFIYSERHNLFSGIRSPCTHCELDGNLITEALKAAHMPPATNTA